MKNFYKKIFVGLAAGAIIVTGSTMLLDTANAASSSNRPRPVVTQEQPPRYDINIAIMEVISMRLVMQLILPSLVASPLQMWLMPKPIVIAGSR